MPVASEATLVGSSAHWVHFYQDDDDLTAAVVDHLGPELVDGGVAVTIATSEHALAIREGLGQQGVNVGSALTSNRLVQLDADATLVRFTVDGFPDRTAFESAIGSVIRHSAKTGRRVAAYGEMVSLLWGDGHVLGALELEKLWNGLAAKTPLSLLCGYSADQMTTAGELSGLVHVCNLHSDIVGGPSLEAAQIIRTFPAAPDTPSRARHLVIEQLCRWGYGSLVTDASLVVTELATNVVVHAKSALTLSLARRGGSVLIGVGDRNPTTPEHRAVELYSPGGRGLWLIEAFTTAWGCTPFANGKLIWAELSTNA